ESYPRYSKRLKPSTRTETASLGPTYPTIPHTAQVLPRLRSSNGSPVIARPNRVSWARVSSPAVVAVPGSAPIGAPHRSHVQTRLRRARGRRPGRSSLRVLQFSQRILDRLTSGALHFKLEAGGYAVLQERTGQHGLERAGTTEPDVILVDSELPDMAGVELCRMLRADPRVSSSTPILLTIRDAATREQRLAALRAGAWEC